jgi:hypothetical protein
MLIDQRRALSRHCPGGALSSFSAPRLAVGGNAAAPPLIFLVDLRAEAILC